LGATPAGKRSPAVYERALAIGALGCGDLAILVGVEGEDEPWYETAGADCEFIRLGEGHGD